ncbi:MAG: tRNA (adenosine(37)-N6)-threonylcarbamoyltransferase complex dimerization subunit type 1 TsaB [Lachnospiraceae bacterium]|nr:tRNA (adenosine(37)-N6)-threonylcarbamoyltransferase complex dimerization subunit type 1 TsaB [Lachnospiraceae bacterium]
MKVLAIDSSGLVASCALVEEDHLIAEYTVDFKKTHSQTLLPMIEEITRMTECELQALDAIAVAGGPGSFTGLRIGAATAKGLGLALEKPIISVPTVDAMAYGLFGASGLICPIMDARRSQVYTGLYRFVDGEFVVVKEQWAEDVEALVTLLNEFGEPVTFLGDGVPVYQKLIDSLAEIPVHYAPAHVSRQRAASVGALAILYGIKKAEPARDHRPIYLRKSQAEREREAGIHAKGSLDA